MDTCPTKRIKADNEQGFIVINEEDFDQAKHEEFDASEPDLFNPKIEVAASAAAKPGAAKKRTQ